MSFSFASKAFFLHSFHSDADPPSTSRGEHTHTGAHTLAASDTMKGVGDEAEQLPERFAPSLFFAVSPRLISSVCVSPSRTGAPSYLTPAHTVNPTIQFMY